MDEEIQVIVNSDTWDLVSLPNDHNTIGVKWVYKTKRNVNRGEERYKA